MIQSITASLIVCSVLFWSCSNPDCDPVTTIATYAEGKEIQVILDSSSMEYIYNIEEGEKTVFEHDNYNCLCNQSGDFCYQFLLRFEIPVDSTSFALQDDEFITADCSVYHENGYVNTYYPVMKGSLHGKKRTDNVWEIKGWVKFIIPGTFSSERTILVDKDFVK